MQPIEITALKYIEKRGDVLACDVLAHVNQPGETWLVVAWKKAGWIEFLGGESVAPRHSRSTLPPLRIRITPLGQSELDKAAQKCGLKKREAKKIAFGIAAGFIMGTLESDWVGGMIERGEYTEAEAELLEKCLHEIARSLKDKSA